MAPEKQQPFDATQILNDITLVNQANKIEIEQIKEHLNLRISNAGLDGAIAETIIEEVTNQLGQLSVKVDLLEKSIRDIRSTNKWSNEISTTTINTRNIQPQLQFKVDKIAGNKCIPSA